MAKVAWSVSESVFQWDVWWFDNLEAEVRSLYRIFNQGLREFPGVTGTPIAFGRSMLQDFKVYHLAVEFYQQCKQLKLPFFLKDQLMRASSSVRLRSLADQLGATLFKLCRMETTPNLPDLSDSTPSTKQQAETSN